MAWRVTITFPDAVGDEGISLVHRVRNFGETLFRHFREDDRGFIELKDVDLATKSLVIERVHKRDLRRTVKLLELMSAKEFPERVPEITTAKMPD
jgi:hypothetical protein